MFLTASSMASEMPNLLSDLNMFDIS